jgi:hypothetical protein
MEQLQSHIWLTASSYMGKYLRISSYIRKPFLVHDFATAPLRISLYMRKIWFSFLSVYYLYLLFFLLIILCLHPNLSHPPRILSSNLSRGYLVQPVDTPPGGGAPGWLPAYCLHPASQGGRRGLASWGFRVRKSSFTRGRPGGGADHGEAAIRYLHREKRT